MNKEQAIPMEIERRWRVTGWPDGPRHETEELMRQGYVTTRPAVRIREEATVGGDTTWMLCLKNGKGIACKEIEFPIEETHFREIESLIGCPLIQKIRRIYLLPDGSRLEVNHVDEGLPTEFWYAEVEFPDIPTARSWSPAANGLSGYLADEVTDKPGQSMAAYWEQTRQ